VNALGSVWFGYSLVKRKLALQLGIKIELMLSSSRQRDRNTEEHISYVKPGYK
jgi:hypothetical protein